MYNLKYKSETWLLTALIAFALSAMPTFIQAQTIICPTASGTWTPAGNPYIIACDSTVPTGQTLTIQPGVVVWMGSNVTLTVNGLIQAVGTPANRITFGTNGVSWHWNAITLSSLAGTHQFKYCDFQNANVAISMNSPTANCDIMFCNFQNVQSGVNMRAVSLNGGNLPLSPQIFNCTFSNCVSQAIYGEAYGQPGPCGGVIATLNPVIKNSTFYNASNGCVIKIWGGYCGTCYCTSDQYGRSNPKIIGNVFCNITNTAFFMDIGSYAASSYPIFINNTVVNAATGVSAQDPWDAMVQDCIFVGCTNATMRSGTNSLNVKYNDYFSNATNFSGYPPSFGQIVLNNRNGIPCDVFYNIFGDPQFLATNDFHVWGTSWCIDAGTPDWNYSDMCFPPAQGSAYPDLGAYGGPDAWIPCPSCQQPSS